MHECYIIMPEEMQHILCSFPFKVEKEIIHIHIPSAEYPTMTIQRSVSILCLPSHYERS